MANLQIRKIADIKSWKPWIFCVLTLLSIGPLFQFVDLSPQVDSDFFFSSEDPQLKSDEKISKIFTEGSQLIIISALGDMRSPEYFNQIKLLSKKLSSLPEISSVKSLTHGPKDFEDAFESPLWQRFLLSEDKKSSNLILLLREGPSEKIIPEIEEIINQFNVPKFQLKISGVPYVVEMIRRSLMHDLKIFSTVAFIIFGTGIAIVFRSVPILIGTLVSCFAACVLTLFAAHLLQVKVGILTANLSTIIFVVTLSHIVFLTNNWRYMTKNNLEEDNSVQKAVHYTLYPSFWSMLATLLGFLSLLFVQAKPLRELGVAGSIGTLFAILIAYLIYPPFLKLAKLKPKKQKTLKSKILFSEQYGRVVLLAFIFTVSASAGLRKINTDPSLLSYFSGGSELRHGLEYIDRNGGSSPLRIVLKDSQDAQLNTAKAYERLWKLQEALEKNPSVGVVISLPIILAEANRAPLAFLLTWEGLIKKMEDKKYRAFVRRFITEDRKYGFFLLRMKESDRTIPRVEVVERIKETLKAHGFTAELTGGLYSLQGQMSALIASSLVHGLRNLILLFVVIGFIVTLSIRGTAAMIASLCIIPVCVLGVIGFLKLPLDIISSPATNITLGMGIDAMLHLATAARRLRRQGLQGWEVWNQARSWQWKAILGNGLIVCVGFGIFSLSTFPPTQRFGLSVVFGTLIDVITTLIVFPFLAGAPMKIRSLWTKHSSKSQRVFNA
jgi:predicted RND superfamily exporter protein